MNPNPPVFEDLSLKRALTDLAGHHKASESLRGRVAAQMAAVQVESSTVRSPSPALSYRLTPMKSFMAIAATLVVASGVAFVAYRWHVDNVRQQIADRAEAERIKAYRQHAVAPTNVWTEMAALHEKGTSGTDAASQPTLVAALTQPAALAAEASVHLNRRVPVPTFASADWKLDRSNYCTITNLAGVSFHFVNGSKSITIISLPEAAWANRTSDSYNITVDEHAIAGYVKDGSLNCVVGGRGMPLDDVQHLVDQLRAE